MLVCFSVLLAQIWCLILPLGAGWSHCNLWGKYLIRMLLNRVLFTWENVSGVNVQLGRLLFSQERDLVPAGPVLKYVIRLYLKHLGYPEGILHLFLRNLPVEAFIQLSHWDAERWVLILTIGLREARPYFGHHPTKPVAINDLEPNVFSKSMKNLVYTTRCSGFHLVLSTALPCPTRSHYSYFRDYESGSVKRHVHSHNANE